MISRIALLKAGKVIASRVLNYKRRVLLLSNCSARCSEEADGEERRHRSGVLDTATKVLLELRITLGIFEFFVKFVACHHQRAFESPATPAVVQEAEREKGDGDV
jgi:hypothetical protein